MYYKIYPSVEKNSVSIEPGKFLGKGSFAQVYEYGDNKVLKILNTISKRNKPLNKREIQNTIMHIFMLKKVKSLKDFIPDIYEFGYKLDSNGDLEAFYIIMENTGIELKSILKEKKLSFKNKIEIFQRVVMGINLMHRNGFIHRDLKPGNITIKEEGDFFKAYIIDFGFLGHISKDIESIPESMKSVKDMLLEIQTNKLLEQFNFVKEKKIKTDCVRTGKDINCTNYMGTLYYLSPEFIAEHYYHDEQCTNLSEKERSIGHKHDVFALGIIFLELLCDGCRPISGDSEYEFLSKICLRDNMRQNNITSLIDILDKVLKTMEKGKMLEDFKELIFGMLRYDPKKRLNTTKILQLLEPIKKKISEYSFSFNNFNSSNKKSNKKDIVNKSKNVNSKRSSKNKINL